ncbi:hypothetical protein, partial [Escherichia coli]|uniref:hypothetical protein n=1 Tax=Escherichia coli TaxID=562 RepID=UPI001BC9170E
FVLGPIDKKELEHPMVDLAKKLGCPILADPLSGLRSYAALGEVVIDQYDAFLREAEILVKLTPEVVIRFGSMTVSKPLNIWLEQLSDIRF